MRSCAHTHTLINHHQNDLETVNMITYCETASHRRVCQLYWEQINENSNKKKKRGGKKRGSRKQHADSQCNRLKGETMAWAELVQSWVYTGSVPNYLWTPLTQTHTHTRTILPTNAQPTTGLWFNDSTDTYAIVLPLIMGWLEELVLTAQACIFKTIMCNQTQCSC